MSGNGTSNALRVGGFTLPNPIVMVENMLADGVLLHNDNHATDNFGKLRRGNPKEEWAFLGGDGRHLKADDHAHETTGGGTTQTTVRSTATASGGGATTQVTQYGTPVQQTASGTRYAYVPSPGQKSPTQSPTQSPVQSPVQSPIQSPIQGPPQKVVKTVPVKQEPPIKKGLQNPLAVPVGIADGLIDFITHCVGAHVDFLWKDPGKLLRDPLGAIKLNQLEINPMGHIFKSIEQANQRDNPMEQLREIPMGLETLPFLAKKGGGSGVVQQSGADHKH